MRKHIGCAVVACALASPAALAQTTIGDTGAFFAGGRLIEINRGEVAPGRGKPVAMIGQAYVEYFIPPKDKISKPPLVLFPGLGLSASLFLMKPPAGDNWVNYFVRYGYPVYLFYRPGEGASGFYVEDVNAAIRGEKVAGLQPMARGTAMFGSGASRPSGYDHTYPDQQFPKDREFAQQVMAAKMPQGAYGPASQKYANFSVVYGEWGGDTGVVGPDRPRYDGGANALIALLEKIGPSIVLGHSLAGPTVINAAAARPELFSMVIPMEPSACPVASGARMRNLTFFHVDGRRPAEFYKDDPARLAKTKRVNADCEALGREVVKVGGKAGSPVYPVDHGEFGNSHYLMVDTNNIKVAELIRLKIESLLGALDQRSQ